MVARGLAEKLATDPRVCLIHLFGLAAEREEGEVQDLDLAIGSTPAFSMDELLELGARLGGSSGLSLILVPLERVPIVLDAL